MTRAAFRVIAGASVMLNVLVAMACVLVVEKKGGMPWVRLHLPEVMGQLPTAPAGTGVPSTTLSVYSQLSVGPGDIVMLGDDLLADGEWHELLGDGRVKNRANVDDGARAILERLAPIVEGRPRSVVLSCGINDLRYRVPRARIAEDYTRIVRSLASGPGGGKVWLLPILPVNRTLYRRCVVPDLPYLHIPTRHEIDAMNTLLKALAAATQRVHAVEMPELVDAAGQLRAEYTLDGLHLSGTGLMQVAAHLRRDLGLGSGQ